MNDKLLWVNETTVHVETRGGENERHYYGGESGWYETRYSDTGELYKSCLKTYGGCEGKMYLEDLDGPIQIGWVFGRNREYEDTSNKHYFHEVCVEVSTTKPYTESIERTVTHPWKSKKQ